MEENNLQKKFEDLKEEFDNMKKRIGSLTEGMTTTSKEVGVLKSRTRGLEEYKDYSEKVFKTANNYSTMDVGAALNYWKDKEDEKEYKGKIIFNITEHEKGKQRKYLQAFIPKSKAKMLAKAISENKFSEYFPKGFINYGMKNDESKERKTRSRILKISQLPDSKYRVEINDAPGKVGSKGNVMPDGNCEMSVRRQFPFDEAVQMGIEIYDFIKNHEMIQMIKGKPNTTVTTYKKPNDSKGKKHEQPKEKNVTQDYIIPGGEHKGRSIKEIPDRVLKELVNKSKGSEHDLFKELYEKSVQEVKRRIGKNAS